MNNNRGSVSIKESFTLLRLKNTLVGRGGPTLHQESDLLTHPTPMGSRYGQVLSIGFTKPGWKINGCSRGRVPMLTVHCPMSNPFIAWMLVPIRNTTRVVGFLPGDRTTRHTPRRRCMMHPIVQHPPQGGKHGIYRQEGDPP